MKKFITLFLLLTVLSGVRVEAQQLRQRDAAVLDSVTQSYLDAMVVMRDTLLAVRVTASRVSRDFGTTAYAVVVSRVRRLRQTCDAASIVAMEQAGVFDTLMARPHLAEPVGSVAESLRALSESITNECTNVFTPELTSAPDSLTGWGPYHLSRVQRLERRYVASAFSLARAANFRIEATFRR